MTLETPGPVRVLFVCLGNICRSPMAEAVFSHMVREAALEDRFEIDSAGTGHWHVGEPPHRGTRQVLERAGIEYAGRARLLIPRDLQRFDYIVAMDRANLRDIQSLLPTPELPTARTPSISLLLEHAPSLGFAEVPDPYYDGRFQLVYELVRQACAGLLATIRRERGI